MLTPKDRNKISKRKRLWDYFGWVYKGIGGLNKGHSLNCGCSQCQWRTDDKRANNKRMRAKSKLNLKDKEN